MAATDAKRSAGAGGNHVGISIVNKRISVSPDPLPVVDHNVVIEWQILTSGWSFPTWEDGIVLNTQHPDFSNGASDGTGKVYTIRNINSEKRLHKYTVHVTDGKETISLDPTIENQG
jgi:uncharacterized protein (UPF0210 family)